MTVFDFDLEDAFHLTIGYVGRPGARAFFLQAQAQGGRATLAIEKVQAEGIAEIVGELLGRIGTEPLTDWDRGLMELRPPIEATWRVGGIAIGYDAERDRFGLELAELVRDEGEREGREGRVTFDRDLARRLVAHTTAVIEEGRARCELCARPIEPDGRHVCPSTNGHGRLSV